MRSFFMYLPGFYVFLFYFCNRIRFTLEMENTRRKPEWLKIKLPMGQLSVDVLNTIRGHHLNTICTSGRCPNQGECWGCGTATFMIGGNIYPGL